MKRRSFLAALFAAPVAATAVASAVTEGAEILNGAGVDDPSIDPHVAEYLNLKVADIGMVTGGKIRRGQFVIDLDAGAITVG